MVDVVASAVSPALAALKQRLAAGRERTAELHRDGAQGGQVSAALCELCDEIILAAYREVLERARPADRPIILQQLALVAVGGYGRGDLAPYSDIDLLLLTHPRAQEAVRAFVSELIRDLWDVGLKLSQSVRTPAGCAAMARVDLPARTAFGEARLLGGNAALFADMQRRMQRFAGAASVDKFIKAVLAERAKEHEDYYAATVCLLEPNVKKSPGGLRDLHLLRWVATARYATADPELLKLGGLIRGPDAQALSEASEFLYRIRHELHFQAGCAQDVLTREEQLRLAAWLGYEDDGPLLAVERFMQQYYRRTKLLHDVVMRFIERARRRSGIVALFGRLRQRQVEEFHLRPDGITIDPARRGEVSADAERLLRLFDLARLKGLPVAHDDLESIRTAVPVCAVATRARRTFLEMLGRPAGVGRFLRDLHGVGLLARLLPPFEHAHCLIQFNLLHKYTVDEHTLLAVERAAARIDDRGPIGQAYREIRRKDLLHLALLCHDLGKGFGEDHSEVGKRIAERTAADFGLSAHEGELLVLLVHRHLLMAQTAFRRDLDDERTLVQFARQMATPETLRMLYVLTAADTDAVAPGHLSAWKESLLTELYVRAMEELSGEEPGGGSGEIVERQRRALLEALGGPFDPVWLEQQLSAMPASYLHRATASQVKAHLLMLKDLGPREVRVSSEYLPALGMTQFTVVTRDDLVPGLFSKIAGALAAGRFEIFSAQIITRPDGTLIDTFQGVDNDFTGEPPPIRREEIAGAIRDVLLGRKTVEDLFRSRPASGPTPVVARAVEPQVEIDNDSSDRFTIIDVFADDRHGLLYDITRTLFELGLSVYSARISTHVDQVVDAFYVTTREGHKIGEGAAQEEIRARLMGVLTKAVG